MHNLPHNFRGRLHANGLRNVSDKYNYAHAADLWLVYLSCNSDMSDMYNYAHAIMLPICG